MPYETERAFLFFGKHFVRRKGADFRVSSSARAALTVVGRERVNPPPLLGIQLPRHPAIEQVELRHVRYPHAGHASCIESRAGQYDRASQQTGVCTELKRSD